MARTWVGKLNTIRQVVSKTLKPTALDMPKKIGANKFKHSLKKSRETVIPSGLEWDDGLTPFFTQKNSRI